MKLDTINSKSHNAWWRIGRWLKYLRDWPENGDSPYSLVFCLSVLLVVGLIVKAGH
jgi:hypothetical protein